MPNILWIGWKWENHEFKKSSHKKPEIVSTRNTTVKLFKAGDKGNNFKLAKGGKMSCNVQSNKDKYVNRFLFVNNEARRQ
jgi:hypothetical protein